MAFHQTCGAANNGRQAIIKDAVRYHVRCVHGYALTLALVLSHEPGPYAQIIQLFDSLEKR